MGYIRFAARTGTLAALAAALVLVPAVLASPAQAKSANTAALQVDLRALHHYHGTIDGGFGQYTDKSVHAFQRHYHVSADGEVGHVTLKLLIHGRSSGGGGGGGGGPTGPVRFYRPVDAPITSPFGMRWGRPH